MKKDLHLNSQRIKREGHARVWTSLVVMCCLLLCSGTASAQTDMTVSGVVLDEAKQPLIGVTITLKDVKSTMGTTTNIKGEYTMKVKSNSTLMFSYIGYETSEVAVNKQKIVNVMLKPIMNAIDELVVIGYGSVSRKDLTGSVAKLDVDEVQKNPVSSFQEALGGRIAGVQATSLTGKPGEEVDIVIRGGNSITQSNAPLYVIDGFPMSDNAASMIHPDDIESINVLKDASATAIYGARGANGVIMITTKKSGKGKPKVSYSGYYGIQQTNAKIDVLDPYEFVNLQLALSTTAVEDYLTSKKMKLEDYKNVGKMNWQDHLFRTAQIQSHFVSVSGAVDKTSYSMSGSYFDQTGVMISSSNKRYTGRMTVDQRFNDKFKAGLSANYSNGTVYGSNPDSNSSSILFSMWSTRPYLNPGESIYDLQNPSKIDPTDRRANPLANIIDTKDETNTAVLTGNAYFEYNPISSLKLRVTGGITRNANERNTLYGPRTQSARFTAHGVNGRVIQLTSTSFTNENTLTYDKTFAKKHKVNILGGFTLSQRQTVGNEFGATNIPYENLGLNGMDDGIPRKVIASSSEWRQMSFLGRVNYSYNSKYLFTASFRSDGSSKFVADNRWAFFPSGSVAWVVTEEPFMKPLRNTISNLKLRASWGRTGNNGVSDFASRGQMNSDNKIYPFGGNTTNSAIILTKMDNPFLKWETTEQLDLGVEMSLFSGRVAIEADYYDKKTKDLLLNADIPYSSGFIKAEKNIGSIGNRGFEFTLNTVNIKTKSFQWSTNFNISFNRNKVLALADRQLSMTKTLFFTNFEEMPAYIAMVGSPMSQMYGYVYDGLLQESDFYRDVSGQYTIKPNVAVDRTSVQPGFMKFKDINNDGKIDGNDRTIIGDANPDFIGGLNNVLRYKNFDLTVFLQWSYGNDILNGNKYAYTSGSMVNTNYSKDLLNSWTPTNTNTDIPLVGSQRTNNTYNDWMIEDGSFLRLKSVQLGYMLPRAWMNRLKISSVRVYCTLNNLYTWTNYSGFDPEVSTQFSNMSRGFDYSSYPRSFSAVFGLNINF